MASSSSDSSPSSLPLSPGTLRLTLLFAVISIHMAYLRLINRHIPLPYLDEIFHVPQAQQYWAGDWSEWDDKITTPPAVYVWSYVFTTVRGKTSAADGRLGVEDLRFSNAVLLYVLLVLLYLWVAVARRSSGVVLGATETVLQRELVVLAFPLLWFFSTLYYTDLWSALTVVAACVVWEVGSRASGLVKVFGQFVHVIVGLVSMASRQTNVFWVAVFLAGLQVVRTVEGAINVPAGANANVLRDPDVSEAWFEDIFYFVFQLLPATFTHLPRIFIDLWPHITLLASFGAFVIWNGGVVLGDKSNHVATIHTPQMLYIWPCIVFFSWPALLPLISNLSTSSPRQILHRLPRPWLSLIILTTIAAAVHYNTIIHPFTLADNRHYVFYIFRLLTRTPWTKYAVIPIYFACAWSVVNALGSSGRSQHPKRTGDEETTVHLSTALVWFASTSLSLITAPLVEPRYFIIPWMIWRMYVPDYHQSPDVGNRPSPGVGVSDKGRKGKDGTSGKKKSRPGTIPNLLQHAAAYGLWIELAWYLVVNYITCSMFLYREFEWVQEPGSVQRFMW